MREIRYESFYRYDEMTAFLREAAAEHPERLTLASLARTPEGRELWLATLTDPSTGPAESKPAYYVQAGIHAQEGAGTTAALHLLHTLLSDAAQAGLLRRVAFYIVPRVNPDGTEYAITARAPIRSRLEPTDAINGLVPQDLDGDGRVLSMRWQDPAGPFRQDDVDPRFLVRREPGDQGPFYQVCTEGLIQDYDGSAIQAGNRSIDFNRNYASRWEPSSVSSRYPFCEVETRAVAEFTLSRPNIFAGVDVHCGTNAILRLSPRADSELDQGDLEQILTIGRRAEAITGLPLLSAREYGDSWRTHPILPGSSQFWAYYHLGISFYVVELGNGFNSAGITAREYFAADARTRETVLMRRVLACHDQAGSEIVAPWRQFDHPQLGQVEIGGVLQGVGYYMLPSCMSAVIPRTTAFALEHAGLHPQLQLSGVEATACAPGLYRLRATVANIGGFSTQVMRGGGVPELRRPVRVSLEIPDGAEILSRVRIAEVGSLADRGGSAKLEWFLRAPAGSTVAVVAHQPRAGMARGEVRLTA
ncbi:MAG: hypothetical protein GX595_12720 [Lentisphaerae bacterium]|nr:hypothetical protein [Lentisphaerota bacterium]